MDDLFDDPIADLLSEGSNDSFFEDPKLTKSKKTTKPLSNIFDFGDDDKKEVKKDIISSENIIKPNMEKSQFSTKTTQPFESRERRLSFEKDDINDLLDSHEPKKSKASLMNEILGISNTDESKVFTFDDILKGSTANKKELPLKKTMELERDPQSTNIQFTNKEPRRGRRGSANIDPLGLLDVPKISPIHEPKKIQFQTIKPKVDNSDFNIIGTKTTGLLGSAVQDKPSSEITSKSFKSVGFLDTKESILSEFSAQRTRRDSGKKQVNEQSDLPDWLKDSKSSIQVNDPVPISTVYSVQKLSSSESLDQADSSHLINVPSETVSTKPSAGTTDIGSVSGSVLGALLKQQQSSTSTLEQSSFALQQQEGHLMVALQLKKYEQNLADMQRTQQEVLMKQEQQFNLLIEKQFSKQHMMEENMRLQQERINQHIHLLLSQPVSSNLKQSFDEQQKKEDLLKETFEENRAFYGDIVNSLKQKHQEEISILEESYKKQLGFLEMSLESTENRLKSEIDNITSYFNSKISEESAKHAEVIEGYEEKIKKINEQNEILMREIKENYNELVKEIKSEYKTMIEDVNRNKNRDEEVISNAGVFTEKLNTGIDILKKNTDLVSEMQINMKNESHLLLDLKADSLNAKEYEIKMMQTSLEKQRTTSDNERAQLLALVKTLEMRLVEQTQSAREERWTLQQATATIAARAMVMDKEMQYIKNNLEYEREQLKHLKETHLAENEKIMLQLSEEKLAIAAERSRLETSSKLSQNYDLNRGKAEIEAALQVAREATDLTDREREKLCRKQCEIETIKRTLLDKERKLIIKERELENISKMADQKYRDGERALLEAKMIDSKCTEKLKDVQRHSSSLANREKKLAEEKISLSKERLAIHNIGENKCSLCKVDGYQNMENSYHEDNLVEQDHSDSYKVQDLELMRLKHELDDTVPTSIREND